MGTLLHALIINYSDNIDSLHLELEKAGYNPVFGQINTINALDEALDRQEWDIIIADSIFEFPIFSRYFGS